MTMEKTLSVVVMGTGTTEEPERLEIGRKFFDDLAKERLAAFTSNPAPFIAPCTDGLLVIYNVIRDSIGVSGEAAHFREEDLEAYPPLKSVWQRAKKPMTVQGALLYFGFPEKKS